MAFAKRKRARRRGPGRNAHGRFTKAHAAPRRRRRRRRAHAKRRAHRRQRTVAMVRRRRNPTAIVANPFRPVAHRRRRRSRVRAHAGHHHRIHRRRRRNPGMGSRLRGMQHYVRIGIFGGAGIIVSRIAGYAYKTYIADKVIGTETDTAGWRHTLSDVLRLFFMGAVTVGVGLGLKRARSRIIRPEDAQAFLVGGLAEAGRQAIGLAVLKMSPTTDRAKYGLDGDRPRGYVTPSGQVYLLASDGKYYPKEQMGGAIMDASTLAGAVMRAQDLARAA